MEVLTRMGMAVLLGIALYGSLLAVSIAGTVVSRGPALAWDMLGALSLANKAAVLLALTGWSALAAGLASRAWSGRSD